MNSETTPPNSEEWLTSRTIAGETPTQQTALPLDHSFTLTDAIEQRGKSLESSQISLDTVEPTCGEEGPTTPGVITLSSTSSPAEPSQVKKRIRVIFSEDDESAGVRGPITILPAPEDDTQPQSETAPEMTQGTSQGTSQGDDDDDDDDEEIESDAERELKEVEFMINQCESYTEALVIGEDSGKIDTVPQPKSVPLRLRNYQLVGINWLALLHTKNLNGILADEMGLGKTCQTIAFMAHLHERGETEPHLVVVPSSTMHNWEREIHRFAPNMNCIVYHGTAKERASIQVKVLDGKVPMPDFLVTTYNMITTKRDRAFMRRFAFNYLVLDEAHAIKNPKSNRYSQLTKVAAYAKHRLLLTGTPLQNNLSELFALLNFLMPDVLQYEQLARVLNAPRTEKSKKVDIEHLYIQRAKKILNPFILRRLKAHVSSELVPKLDKQVVCVMPEIQRIAYEALVATSKRSLNVDETGVLMIDENLLDLNGEEDVVINPDDEEVEVTKRKREPRVPAAPVKSPLRRRAVVEKKGATANILMQLRKMANHPLLCRIHFDDERIIRVAHALIGTMADDFANYPVEELIEDLKINSDFEIWRLCESHSTAELLAEVPPRSCLTEWSGKMKEMLRLVKELSADGSKLLLFSQMTKVLDILEVVLMDAGVRFIRLDGQTQVNDRQPLIDRFTNEPELTVFLLSTRAGGLGINLVAANIVIFFDFGFNPQVERQAEDRAHRLGQTKEVHVIRLILENTIDQNIMQLAEEKKRLNDIMLAEGNFVDVDNGTKQNHRAMASMLSKVLSEQ